MFTQEKWEQITSRIMEELSIFKERDRLINRQFLAPAQEVEIDKAGRITIPPTLRLAAELKRDTVILASDKYIEIWDEEERLAYSRASEENFKEAAEDLGIRLSI